MAETTKIIIEAEDNASGVFKKFEKQLGDTKKQTEDIADTFKKVGASFVALGTAGAFGIKQLVDAAAGFEQTQVAFTTMTGSAQNAQKVLSELATFAANTPFNLTGIQTAAKQLLAYGVQQEDLIPQLKTLGDVAAGVGMDKFPQLTLAYGQVMAATKLTGSELRQFSEAGVPLLGTLADQFGVTAGQMQEMISAGSIGFKDVEKAFQTLTGEGGRFQDLMEKQSKTFSGQFSNLQDNFDQLKIALGAPLLEPLKKVNKVLLDITGTIKDFTKEHPQIASLVAQLALLATTFLIVVGSLGLLMGMKATFIAGFLAMKTVVMAIGAALLSPWTLVIIAIGLVIAAIVWLVKNWDMVKEKAKEIFGFVGDFISGIWESIVSFTKSIWEDITGFLKEKMDWIAGVFSDFFESVKNGFGIILDFFSSIWKGIVDVFEFFINVIVGVVAAFFELLGIDLGKVVTAIKDGFTEMWNDLKGIWEWGTGLLKTVWDNFSYTMMSDFEFTSSLIKDGYRGMWEDIGVVFEIGTEKSKSAFSVFSDWINKKAQEFAKGLVERFGTTFTQIIDGTNAFGSKFSEVWDGFWKGVKEIFNGFADGIVSIWKGATNILIGMINKVISAINSVGEKGSSITGVSYSSIPEIPKLAKGGIVTKPTLAMIGEAGAEAVVPLSGGNRPGLGNITINITGTFMSEEASEKMADEVIRQLKLYGAVV